MPRMSAKDPGTDLGAEPRVVASGDEHAAVAERGGGAEVTLAVEAAGDGEAAGRRVEDLDGPAAARDEDAAVRQPRDTRAQLEPRSPELVRRREAAGPRIVDLGAVELA